MKRRKIIFSVMVVVMIAGTAVLLATVPQKLGKPGLKASAIPGSPRLDIYLPETILGYSSTNQELDAKSLEMLPADTSTAQRIYYKRGHIPFVASVVMMGSDRTSIHKAEFCLTGQGMHIDQMTTDTVRVEQAKPYDLPVIKILASTTHVFEGKMVTNQCVYVYWYVADGALSNDHRGVDRMWATTKNLVLTGVLQRWAYVRFYAVCNPADEDAVYQEIKQAIASSVPDFQLTTGSATAAVAQK